MYYVYILKSLNSKRFYTSCSSDVSKRLLQHNSGGTPSTKPYRPWTCVYTEVYDLKTEAMKREWYLKHPKGHLEKRQIIEKHGGVA